MIHKSSNNSQISIKLKKAGEILIFVFLVLHLTTADASSISKNTNSNIHISYEKDLLSIQVKETDLKAVIFKLADKTNIHVELPVSIEKKITINKSGISLGEGLVYILENLNYIIFYSGIKNKKPLISKVFVFSRSKYSKTSADSETQSDSRKIQPAHIETQLTGKIKAYKSQIENLKKKLSRIPQNSRRGKHYSKRIKLLERLIDKYEARLYLTELP